jgi:hypothetical protein
MAKSKPPGGAGDAGPGGERPPALSSHLAAEGRELNAQRDTNASPLPWLGDGVERAREPQRLRPRPLGRVRRRKGRPATGVPVRITTESALDRYLAVRHRHFRAEGTDALWIGVRGPLGNPGVRSLIERRARGRSRRDRPRQGSPAGDRATPLPPNPRDQDVSSLTGLVAHTTTYFTTTAGPRSHRFEVHLGASEL